MDKYFNSFIEKTVKKPITAYERELIKVGVLGVIGLFIAFLQYGFSIFNVSWFITVVYPIGFYYGWRTIVGMLKGNTSNSIDTALITTLFSGGNGYMGFIFGILQFALILTLAFTLGWIVGLVNLAKTLMFYKKHKEHNISTGI
ncbi:hypothetical protein Amet_4688 [Alkaliphilus metalliredigens QYMF]|uniref:Uncharacterized protein n=1 Tax=Alkaliphilus metalliredigens (strain QYMF) TaxID=293826 RepID=A6TX38_ALKMQ|nr:hypothetical protein [Alkaliphilus metalliredigens]ABR50756.1 hypothetical protein Amet_4688 [Alkaliphilus metalliredigens QYMF]